MRICVSYFNERKETAIEFMGSKHFRNLDSPDIEKLIETVIEKHPIVVDIGGNYDYYEINIAEHEPTMTGAKGTNGHDIDDFCEILLTEVESILTKNGNLI